MRYKRILTAVVCLVIMSTAAACGKSSARTVSPPPESTPAWVDADEIAESISERDEQIKSGSDNNRPNDKASADTQQNNAYGQAQGTEKDKGTSLPDISIWKNVEPGWYERPEGWYYIGRNMQLVTGWTEVGQYTYYLDEATGILATEDIVDGAYVNRDGVRRELTGYEKQLLDTEGEDAVLKHIAGYERPNGGGSTDTGETPTDTGTETEAGNDKETDAISGDEAAEQAARLKEEQQRKQSEAQAAAQAAAEERAAAAAMAAFQEAANAYSKSGSSDITGIRTETVLKADMLLSGDGTGTAAGTAVTETEDCIVIEGASVTGIQTVPAEEVEKLSAKDNLTVTCNEKEYELVVMSTGTDENGHKTVSFNDDLIRLSYTDDGYTIETADSHETGSTVYTGQIYIRKDAVIESSEGSSSAAEYIRKALVSGQQILSGSLETDGSGRIIRLSE